MPHRRSFLKGAGALGAAAVLPVGRSEIQRGKGSGIYRESITLVNPDPPYQPGDTITLSVDTTGGPGRRINWVRIAAEKPNANEEDYIIEVDEYVPDSQSSVRLSWTIPEDAPTGEYDFLLEVWEYISYWVRIDTVEALTLDISDESGNGGSSEYLSGTIEDVNGRPVPNATVSLFAYDKNANFGLNPDLQAPQIGATTTSTDGSYILEQAPVSEFGQYEQSYTRMLLVAESDPDRGDRRWFDSVSMSPSALPSDGSFPDPLRLSHQVIFSELVPENGSRVSIWRTVVDNNTIDIHIAVQSDASTKGAPSYGGGNTPINTSFSLRVPETAKVDYNPVSTKAEWSGESDSDIVLMELAAQDSLSNLPIAELAYTQIDTFDKGEPDEKQYDDLRESLSDALGFVPGAGFGQGILTATINLFDLDEAEIAATVGNRSPNGIQYDPNTQDMINSGTTANALEAVAAMSTTRIQLSEETDFAVRANWNTQPYTTLGAYTAELHHEFTVSPSNQGQAISTSTVTTAQQTTSQSQMVQASSETPPPPPSSQTVTPIVEQYDQNDDGDISVEELGEAGQDFAADELTIEELAEIGQEFAND